MPRSAFLVAVALAAAALAPSPADAVSRRGSARIALRVLAPSKARAVAGVAVYQRGLRPGDVVTERTLGLVSRAARPIRVRHRAWMFWEDLGAGAFYAHPSRILVLDGRTGRVVARRALEVYPLVNGRAPPFVVRPSGRGRIFARSLVVRPRTTRAVPSAHAAQTKPAKNGFVMLTDNQTGGNIGGTIKHSKDAMSKVFNDAGIAPQGVGTFKDLQSQVASQVRDGKTNITVYLHGHGAPDKTVDPKAGTDHALMSLGEGGGTVSAADLNQMMKDNPGTKFNFIIDSCYSGRWPLELKGDNLGAVANSSGANEPSLVGAEFSRENDGRFKVTLDGAGEKPANFTGAMSTALEQVLKNAGPDGDVTKAIEDAKANERNYDGAALIGLLHPNTTGTYEVPGALQPH